jgi:tRNA(Arg) A34 adenosine deaminase TadA
MTSPEPLLRAAVALAWQARANGNHPFGALLADGNGQVLLTAENSVVTESDVTGHAETNLVRLASAAYTSAELADLTLYTSTEPCAMCAGAIYWSGIGAVVYATKRPDPWPRVFGFHEVFHVCTVVGAGLHLAVIGLIVLPRA